MRIDSEKATKLLESGDLLELGHEADEIKKARYGNTVTFIVDRNINYTNVCVNECKFCAFYRRQGEKAPISSATTRYSKKVADTVAAGGTQVMIQGGLHPDLGLDYYEKMLRLIHEKFPQIVIHSFTATEILYFAEKTGISVTDTLKRLQAAGLASLPGGGAEILVDRIENASAPRKS